VLGQIEWDTADGSLRPDEPLRAPELVDALASAIAVLTLDTPDVALLLDAVTAVPEGRDLVLTDDQHAAYRRLARRWTQDLMGGNDALHRYIY